MRRVDLLDVDRITEAVQASLTEVGAWMAWAHPGYDRRGCATWLCAVWTAWDKGTAWEFVIEDGDDLLGLVGLNGVDGERCANLGYWVRTDRTGRGVCTAAAGAVVRFAFEDAGLRRLRLFHAAGNAASARVAEKLGFRREGLERGRMMLHDVAHDAVTYGLLREEWG